MVSVLFGLLGWLIDGSVFIGMDLKYVDGREARKVVGVYYYLYFKGVFIGVGVEVMYFSM